MNTITASADLSAPAARARLSAAWVSRIVMLGATSIVVGILWDISWHRTIGRDTFWTPAHLAIQLGGLLGGFISGWLVLSTTFRGTAAEKSAAVKLWGFRGPIGAWVTIWGCLAMLISAPFDNWWHDAYGLDVKILSPPHTVLALGMWAVVLGALLLVLREQNNGAPASSTARTDSSAKDFPQIQEGHRLSASSAASLNQREEKKWWNPAAPAGSETGAPSRWLFVFGNGVLLAMASVFLTEYSFPNQQHTAPFYLASSVIFPLYLVGIARAAKFRWSATLTALGYMLIVAIMAWILPLFPGEPKLGPIANRVDHFVPLPFPLLLVVPAFAIDLIRNFIGAGQRWWRDVLIVVLSAVAFVALFSVTQWYFSKFLLSEYGQNWFFAADRHWGYTESPGEWRTKFWDSKTSRNEPTATLSTFALALACALGSSALGLLLGNWMAKVRR